MKKQNYHFRYKVAVVQFEPTIIQKEENLLRLLGLAENAAEEGAKLIVLPEMATTGYCWYSQEEIKLFVEEIPGPTTERFAELANSYKCFIVLGLPEVDPISGSYYNALAFIGPSGLLGKYRKTHLFVADARWAREGDLGFPIFDTEIGLISGLICQDLMYFEPARILALKEVHAICCPSNWLRQSHPSALWAVRAFENGVYLICANRWGEERGISFHGNSCIINPNGTIQNMQVEGDGVVFGEVDTTASRSKSINLGEKEDIILDRVPDNYHILSLNPYVHNPTRFFELNRYRPLPKGQRSLIATISIKLIMTSLEDRLQQMADLVAQAVTAAPAPLQLIVFPELTAGITVTDSVKEACGQRVPGNSVAAIGKLVSKYNLYIVSGLIEQDGDNFFHTVILVGPEGYIGKYRKIHLSPYDRQWLSRGNLGFSTFDIPLGRVGLLLGYDLLFPESARCLALSGTDLICIPSIPQSLAVKFEQLAPMQDSGIDRINYFLRVRAGENNLYLALADCSDTEGSDVAKVRGGIFGPNLWFTYDSGKIRLRDGEIMTLSFIDTSSRHDYYQTNVVRNKELLVPRQTRWYDLLFNPQPPLPNKKKGDVGSETTYLKAKR